MLPSSPLSWARLTAARSRRASSYDRRGGNRDRISLAADETAVLLDVKGPGCVTHIWITAHSIEHNYLRKVLLRMYWDGEKEPSVLVPLGDFFGMGHGETATFWSLPLVMAPSSGTGLNSYFPMPFSSGARIEVTSENFASETRLYYNIDYEEWPEPQDDLGRFHAQWRRENPTDGIPDAGMTSHTHQHAGRNRSDEGNYVILEAEGRGHYVGCNLNIHNLRPDAGDGENWYGEGDEMMRIDGEEWPVSIHGTGTEDYFNTAWGPSEPFSSPFFGIAKTGGANWSGKVSWYRFHLLDPVHFQKSIRVSIEHGHANRRSDDYASTAYWYQAEPHKPFGVLPVEQRIPRSDFPAVKADTNNDILTFLRTRFTEDQIAQFLAAN
ncbi:MAG: DUF2961 domain-containing protein [Anaerolineae bacterium]|nr:DUF2961 domain-containing protein [Anaerolineae bacterium]